MTPALKDMLDIYQPKTLIDYQNAADEVRVFLPDPRELDLWSKEFFRDLAGRMCNG